MESLGSMFHQALERVEMNCSHWEQMSIGGGEGGGGVTLCLHPTEGTAVLTYDGRSHVDVSYYRIGMDPYNRMMPFQEALVASFMTHSLGEVLHDEMPRGVGRTINAAKDLHTPQELQSRLERLKSGYFRRRNRHAVETEEEEEDDDDEEQEDGDEKDENTFRDEL